MIHGPDLTVRDQRAKNHEPGVRKAELPWLGEVEKRAGGF